MKHLEVLVFTKNTTRTKILNWKVSTVHTVETAIQQLQQRPFKVLAIAAAMEKTDKMKLKKLASILWEDMILVEYSNDEIVSEKVKRSYWTKNIPMAERSYLDNSIEIKLANSIQLN